MSDEKVCVSFDGTVGLDDKTPKKFVDELEKFLKNRAQSDKNGDDYYFSWEVQS
jgi:hypothetical protein